MSKQPDSELIFKETCMGWGWLIPKSKKRTCLIREIYGNTGWAYNGERHEGGKELDHNIHKGFTVGKNGRTMYWAMIWHSWGNVTVYPANKESGGRWLQNNDEQEITIHFK